MTFPDIGDEVTYQFYEGGMIFTATVTNLVLEPPARFIGNHEGHTVWGDVESIISINGKETTS